MISLPLALRCRARSVSRLAVHPEQENSHEGLPSVKSNGAAAYRGERGALPTGLWRQPLTAVCRTSVNSVFPTFTAYRSGHELSIGSSPKVYRSLDAPAGP